MAGTTLYMSPITLLIQFFSNVGLVLNGGFVNTYLAGSTTPVTTYTDSTGANPNANPITLSSAGRMVAGSAPVACWVPQGVAHKMVLTDSGGNYIMTLDNLSGINDPTTLLALFASPNSGSGVDLVANGVKSYFNFAALRAANAPTPASGQTVGALLAGQNTQSDGFGGGFLWNSLSTATDDNYNVIKPGAGGASGRWIRITQPYLPNFNNQNPVPQGGAGAVGLFTSTLQGITAPANPITGEYYTIGTAAALSGGQVTSGQFAVVALQGGATYLGTSTATSMTLALPFNTPNVAQTLPFILEDNAVVALGQAVVQNGTMTFGKTLGTAAGFTGTGTKGIPVPQTFTVQVF